MKDKPASDMKVFMEIAAATATAMLLLCSCGEDTKITTDEETELPEITPLPQPEPEPEPEKYDEEKILSYIKAFSWWDDVEEQAYTEDSQFARGCRCVKFASDKDYVYGYVEVDTTLTSSRYNGKAPWMLNNLGVWLDTDGVSTGQGGGWIMCNAPQGFDLLLRGQCSDSASPLQWNPSVNDVSAAGDSFGATVSETEEWSNVGTGQGEVSDNIFRYTFTIDRVRLEMTEITDLMIGISFDYNGYNDNVVVPTRAAFQIALNNE